MIVSKLKLMKFLDLRKIVNLANFLLYARHRLPKISHSMPISVDIEPVVACNLDCVFCHNRELVKAREKRKITLTEFQYHLDQFPSALRINVQGMGEPLLNKETPAMIHYAKQHNKFVTMTSNAMLLDQKKAEQLLDSGLDRLIISLDSPYKQQYEAVRPGAVFETVVNNLKSFIELRGSRKTPEVLIWMLGLENTLDGVLDMIDLAKHIGVDQLVLQHRINSWGKKQWDEKAQQLQAKTQEQLIHQAIEKAREVKLHFCVNTRHSSFKKDADDICTYPWGSAFVATDGTVIPCCMIADPKIAPMGNLFEQDFETIWNNATYQQLRSNLKKGDIPDYCQYCYKK